MGKILKKLGAFSIGPIVGAVISFFTVPLITHFITTEEYGRAGMFALAQSTITTVLYLGMDQAYVREFNAYKDDIKKLLSNAMLIPMALAVLSSIIIVLFEKPISQWLFGEEQRLAVYALALLIPFMVMENFALLTIRMEEKGLQYSLATIFLKCAILAFTVLLFLTYEKSFRSVVYAAALGEVVTGLLLYFYALRDNWIIGYKLEPPLIKKMLCFGLPLVPAFAIVVVLTSMDKVMLRSLDTYGELGLYTAAFKIVSVLSVLQACFTLFWTPVAYRWYENKKSEYYFEITGQFIGLVMSAVCICILLAKNLVGVILGENFRNAIGIFPFLLLYPILYTVSETTGLGIGFKKKTGYTIITSAISGIANIFLNWLLIPRFGGVGAAIATGLSYVFFFWGRTFISRHLWYKFDVKLYAWLIALLIANCAVHTFYDGVVAYLVSAVSLVVILTLTFVFVKNNDLVHKLKEGSFYE